MSYNSAFIIAGEKNLSNVVGGWLKNYIKCLCVGLVKIPFPTTGRTDDEVLSSSISYLIVYIKYFKNN